MFHNLITGLGKATAVTALTLGAVAVAGTAATADTRAFADAHGDLAHGADIHEVTVTHERVLRVTVEHDDLVRSYESGSSIRVYLDTDRSTKGPELAFLGGTFEGADYALVRTDGWKPRTRAVRGFYRMDLDYAADTATIKVGRGLLGDPARVRIAVKTGGEMRPPGSEPHYAADWLGDRRELTAWVPRG